MPTIHELPPQRFFELFRLAFQKRKRLYEFTNAVRLCNGKGDGLPGLTLDQYHRHFLVKIFDPRWASRLQGVREFLVQEFDPAYLIFKDASKEELTSGYRDLSVMHASPQTVVTENGLKFRVDLEDNLNVGLFLDMRENRKIVGEISREKVVLNCFAYTCSFGVYCRKGGASRVVNVDISPKYLDWGAGNYELNRLAYSQEEFVKKNVSTYISRAVKVGNLFDVVILDPPSFSRYEHKVFAVERDLPRLISLALRILKPKGTLFVATNFTGISPIRLEEWVYKSSREAHIPIEKMTCLGQDRDFRGSGSMKESHLAAVLVRLASFPST